MDLVKLNDNCRICLKLLEDGKTEIESGFVFLSEIIQKQEKEQIEKNILGDDLNKIVKEIVKKVEDSPYKLVIHEQKTALRLKEKIKPFEVQSLDYYLNKILHINELSENFYIIRMYFSHPQWLTIFALFDNLN